MKSRSKETRSLRKIFKTKKKNPEMYDEEDVQAARKAYVSSLTDDQFHEEESIKDILFDKGYFEFLEFLSAAAEHHGLDLDLDAPSQGIEFSKNEEWKGSSKAMEQVFRRLLREVEAGQLSSITCLAFPDHPVILFLIWIHVWVDNYLLGRQDNNFHHQKVPADI